MKQFLQLPLILNRFRIMNIEIHDVESWSHPMFYACEVIL